MPSIENVKKRIEWIDVAKGLLIALVLFHHFPKCTSYINSIWSFAWNNEWIYTPFFMASFFVITGFCSNFNLPFKVFLIKNIKTLLVANFFMRISSILLGAPVPSGLLVLLSLDMWMFRSFWFFKALFWSKILFWIIIKFVDSKFYRAGIVLFVSYLGVFLSVYNFFPDYFAHRNGLMFVFFVYLGHSIKKIELKSEFLFAGAILYWCVIALYGVLNIIPPFVHAENNLSIYSFPIWLVLATFGTCFIFLISRITHSRFLSFIGTTTVVTYPLSSRIMRNFLDFLGYFFNLENFILGIFLYIVVPVMTLIICGFLYKFIANTKFKFLIGRF